MGIVALPESASADRVLGPWKENDLLLAFHPDRALVRFKNELEEAKRRLGRTTAEPKDLAAEAFRRVREAAKHISRHNIRLGNHSGPPPPGLTHMDVTVVPTVGDFGLDLVVYFKFCHADLHKIPQVHVEIAVSASKEDARRGVRRRSAVWTTNSFFEGFGELVIQNQALVTKLGPPKQNLHLEITACTANASAKSSAFKVEYEMLAPGRPASGMVKLRGSR